MINLIFSDAAPQGVTSEMAGGKGFHLLSMVQMKMPIPPFFIIPAVETALLFSVKTNDEIRQQKLAQIMDAADACFGPDWLVSIRSSAATEDSHATSFAGQFLTSLFVNKSRFVSELQRVLESAHRPGAKAYTARHQIKPDTGMAIVVQKMVDADKSGIGFSMHPGNNLCNMVVVAGYGCGEGIVSDKVAADTYLINRMTGEISSRVEVKGSRLVNQNGLQEIPVPEVMQHARVLDDAILNEISALLLTAEKKLGTASDIEFSIDGNGKLYILQMRPVTTIHAQNIAILDNTNIVESYPSVSFPLTFEFARQAYENIFRNSAASFGIKGKNAEELQEVFSNLIAHYKGHIYYRLDHWYRMISKVHASRSGIQSWEDAVGLQHGLSATIRIGVLQKIKSVFYVIKNSLLLSGNNKKFYAAYQKYFPVLIQISGQKVSGIQDLQAFDAACNKLFRYWHFTILNDYLAMKAFGFVQQHLQKKGLDKLANDLTGGQVPMESERALLALLDMRDRIKNQPDLLASFNHGNEAFYAYIRSGKAAEFFHIFESNLSRFGDRTLAELKLETPSPLLNPELYVQMIRNQWNHTLTTETYIRNKTQRYQEARKKTKQEFSVLNPLNWLFYMSARIATSGLSNREKMRFCRARAYGAVKRFYLQCGAFFTGIGILEEPSDIFYLYPKEIAENLGKPENSRTIISERKKQYQTFEGLQLPERIMYENQPPELPDLSLYHTDNPNVFSGIAVASGELTAEAIVITKPALDLDVTGKILITKMTDPGWVFLMVKCAGLVSEKGSLLSHTAIVGRELGIPVVVNVKNITRFVKTGDIIRMNGNLGTVEILKKEMPDTYAA